MSAAEMSRRDGLVAAEEYLAERGFKIRDRNWKGDGGSLDIVAEERGTLVVCEVRTRRGTPLEAVSHAKRDRLRRMAVAWLNAHGARFDQVRIDVISVLRDGSGGFTIEHVRAVG